VLLVLLALTFPGWRVALVLYQPDLVYWLAVVAAVLLVKGMFEMGFIARVYGRSHGRGALQAAWN
jgi:hypothetical protein